MNTVCGECGVRPVGEPRYEASRGLCHACYARLSRSNRLPAQPGRDTVVRDCPHAGRHQHGTTGGYWSDLCRCPACAAAYATWRTTPKHADTVLVDATPVRDHVTSLHTQGMPWTQIAAAAGVVPWTVACVASGRPTIQQGTATRLLHVTLGPRKPRTDLLEVTPVRAHCARVHAHGASWPRIAAAARVSHTAVYLIMSGRTTHVTRVTAARLLGVPVDLPPLTPVKRRTGGVDATPVRAHCDTLHATGLSWTQIATRAGVAHKTILRIVHDHQHTVRRDTATRILTLTP